MANFLLKFPLTCICISESTLTSLLNSCSQKPGLTVYNVVQKKKKKKKKNVSTKTVILEAAITITGRDGLVRHPLGDADTVQDRAAAAAAETKVVVDHLLTVLPMHVLRLLLLRKSVAGRPIIMRLIQIFHPILINKNIGTEKPYFLLWINC